jgi:hypothetical protein
MWNSALIERLLTAMITTGAHLNGKKWREAAVNFFAHSTAFQEIYRLNEDNAIRRLKEKFNEEQKRVCQTMGWRDFNQGNLSAFDGDLGPIEAKMRQIIQEQDEKKEEKDKVKKRQKTLGDIGAASLDVNNEGSLKSKSKRTTLSTIISGTSSKASVIPSKPTSDDESVSAC